jgi:hypothetical protein
MKNKTSEKYYALFSIICFFMAGFLTGLIYWEMVLRNYILYLIEIINNGCIIP